MKKNLVGLFLVLACVLFGGVSAAPAVAAENVDLVVMVDTSESMFPYFDDLMNYLVQDLLVDRLHRGDTFHLLSFDSTPEVEIALEMNSAEASQRAFGRILLLHPLGRYTDLVAALQFLNKYVKELPETNPKQIILITDGVNDPPPGSATARMTPDAVKQAITEAAGAMKKEGWTFNLLRVPPQPAPGQAEKSYLSDIARTLGVPVVPYPQGQKQSVTGMTTGFPTLIFPQPLGKVGTRFYAPFRVKNWKAEPIIVRLSSVQSDGAELLERKVSVTVPPSAEAPLDVPIRLPISYPRGDHAASVKLVFDDDTRISPTSGTLTFTFTGRGGFPIPRLTFLYVVYIIIALALIYLLVRLFMFMRKRLQEVPAAGLAKSQRAEQRTERAGARAGARAAGRGAGAAGRAAAREAEAAGAAPEAAGKREAQRAGARGKVPLEAIAAAEGTAGAILAQRKRVRPTVTSLRRALPRQPARSGSLPPLIEMRVSDQNHQIGFRNVHRIPPGGARSVGGGLSSYLIFLVRVPSAIGEIRNVDGKYTFTPLRQDMFPGVPGPVEDCLETEIPFVGPHGREMSLHFREWVSPLDEINKLMRSIRGD